MAAAIAIIKTAPAARSFVFFIISLYSGETKSANDSMDELIASADNPTSDNRREMMAI